MVNQLILPQEITNRVMRVIAYHRSTRLSNEPGCEKHVPDPSQAPYEFRVFEMLPQVKLPDPILDPVVPTLQLMDRGMPAAAEDSAPPAQDLKTLASWLYFANGISNRRRTVTAMEFTRTCVSDGDAFPCELYVAAFGIEGLEPGFYHYSAREFALRKLREGPETLARLTRGRPDLMFLKTVPAALFVSTIFCRSTWRFGKRGYRHVLHDTGHLVQNLVSVADALGIQTMTRLILNDTAGHELIGVKADAEFAEAEAVQAMVIWADRATCPMDIPPASPPSPAVALAPIERDPLAAEVASFVSILETHLCCVAPGMAVREVRPPLTDLSPLAADFPTAEMATALAIPAGRPLRQVLLDRAPAKEFATRAISREAFITLNRLALRGGTFFPLHPDGPHAALVRPIWIIQNVGDIEPAVWYYHPVTDQWSVLHQGALPADVGELTDGNAAMAQASAVGFLIADLTTLMMTGGPDLYRLAHIEAGIVCNRLSLATEAVGLAWSHTGEFQDEACREALGLRPTSWEVLSVIAIGTKTRG